MAPPPKAASRNPYTKMIGSNSATSSTASLVPPSAKKLAPPPNTGKAPPAAPAAKFLRQDNASYVSIPDTRSLAPSISDKFSLAADPSQWEANTSPDFPEPDDYLHNPDPKRDRKNDQGGSIFTSRGIANLGCLFILALGLVTLFAGYPLISYFTTIEWDTLGGYNLGGINASGQVPTPTGNWGLIDTDTPLEAHHKVSYHDGQEWELVFSDEFNVDGRTFYPGDDPYWEAEDLHYWGTNNLEWYDPAAITTEGGNLVITLQRKQTHDLDYEGGLMSSWNKFCFTGGLIEVNAVLPGASDVYGLWPAVWTLGNLGRMGYGASLDGMWPYSYDTCDVGTLPNQTYPNGTPVAATTGNEAGNNGALSFLPGQRLSACTCPDSVHPGPRLSNGSYVGRSAPEIDILEAQVDAATRIGHVSQSGQWAPFDYQYTWNNSTEFYINHEPDLTVLNTYKGGVYQQSTSNVVETNQACYENKRGCYSIYGFEYKPGNDGYITWISDGKKTWTLMAGGVGPNRIVDISQRPIPLEPMYIIVNLGMSFNFGPVEEARIQFPVHFRIDYVRVYQPKDAINVGCSPPEFPTEEYIQTYIEAYTNPNLTTWEQYGQTFPKNRLVDRCE